MIERLLRTAFLTSLFAYLGFALVDYLEPGLVSYVFSVHIWGALALAYGVVWAVRTRGISAHRKLSLLPFAMISVMLFWFFWRQGEVFGGLRLMLALAAALLPWLAWKTLREPTN